MLTHAAAGLPLPDDLGMAPTHYVLCVEARKRDDSRDGYTLLRVGPYTQTRHVQQDHDRITAALDGRETTLVPGHRVSVRYAPFDVSDHRLFADPYEADAVAHRGPVRLRGGPDVRSGRGPYVGHHRQPGTRAAAGSRASAAAVAPDRCTGGAGADRCT
ncbi:hypothetical protein ACF09K_33585 [Streptomyces sp. NPDC014882]|uniref:hypothetical protein n=1 Tax=Streptomyces sp. NPDC014882 TaxID=3364927 RepID=UPI0036F52813